MPYTPYTKHLIFVNYRGTDEIWATEYVYARMTEAFGADAVFKAGNALRPGDQYPQILDEKAAHCPVMLVCIGPSWADTKDASGARRLDSPDDWVRKEIQLALRAGQKVPAPYRFNFARFAGQSADGSAFHTLISSNHANCP